MQMTMKKTERSTIEDSLDLNAPSRHEFNVAEAYKIPHFLHNKGRLMF